MSAAAVERIWQAASYWYRAGMHPAIQVCLRHNGKVVLNRAIGHAHGNGPGDPPDAERVPVGTDTPFCVYSAAKAITTTVVHMLVERGHFSLDDRVRLPARVHQPRQGPHHHPPCADPQRGRPLRLRPAAQPEADERQRVHRRKLAELKPIHRPGRMHIYHGLTWGPLVREIVSAATGQNIRDILAAEVLDPLGFRWTNYGVAESDVPLVAPSYVTGKPLPPPIAAAFRTAVGGPCSRSSVLEHPLFLTGVILRRAPCPPPTSCPDSPRSAPRRRARRCADHAPGNPAGRGGTLPPTAPGPGDGLAPMRWGTGYMLGSTRFGPFGRDSPQHSATPA